MHKTILIGQMTLADAQKRVPPKNLYDRTLRFMYFLCRSILSFRPTGEIFLLFISLLVQRNEPKKSRPWRFAACGFPHRTHASGNDKNSLRSNSLSS